MTALPTSCSPVSTALPSHPYFLRYNIEIRPINNPTMTSKCSRERKSPSYTLNQKLKMVKLSIENQNRLKAYPLSYGCKGKILENFKYYSVEHMDHKQMKQIY